MNMKKLKNGSEEPEPLVLATMTSIHQMWDSGLPGILALSDLVQICRNEPKYKKFGDNEDQLKGRAFLREDGTPHDSVRNIVLSAFKGEGMSLQLISPIAA